MIVNELTSIMINAPAMLLREAESNMALTFNADKTTLSLSVFDAVRTTLNPQLYQYDG